MGPDPRLATIGQYLGTSKIKQQLLPFLREIAVGYETVPQEEVSEAHRFLIHDQDLYLLDARLLETEGIARAGESLIRSTLGSIIGEFEYFVVRLTHIVAKFQPERFCPDEYAVPLSLVKQCSDPAEIIRRATVSKIESHMRESHAEIVKWLLGVLDLSSSKSAITSDHYFIDFLEVCQRRHIIIHNGGHINLQYIDNCKKLGVNENCIGKLGSVVEIDSKYIRRAISRAYHVGMCILHMFIQKKFPQEKEISLHNLLNTSHEFLKAGQTKMCERVVEFAEFSKKDCDYDLKLRFAINKSLAKLFDPALTPEKQLTEAKKILKNYDWSAVRRDPVFSLILACVSREMSGVIEKAKSAALAGLTYEEARTWVVFREARKEKGFLECFPRSLIGLPPAI